MAMPDEDGSRLERSTGGRRHGIVLFLVVLVLMLAATGTVVFSESARLLRLGVLAALWAALAGAFIAVKYRRQISERDSEVADLQSVYELELERESSARREYELEVEAEIRNRVEDNTQDQLAALREELHGLRQTLETLLGGEVLVERVALHAATRMRPLPDSGHRVGRDQLIELTGDYAHDPAQPQPIEPPSASPEHFPLENMPGERSRPMMLSPDIDQPARLEESIPTERPAAGTEGVPDVLPRRRRGVRIDGRPSWPDDDLTNGQPPPGVRQTPRNPVMDGGPGWMPSLGHNPGEKPPVEPEPDVTTETPAAVSMTDSPAVEGWDPIPQVARHSTIDDEPIGSAVSEALVNGQIPNRRAADIEPVQSDQDPASATNGRHAPTNGHHTQPTNGHHTRSGNGHHAQLAEAFSVRPRNRHHAATSNGHHALPETNRHHVREKQPGPAEHGKHPVDMANHGFAAAHGNRETVRRRRYRED